MHRIFSKMSPRKKEIKLTAIGMAMIVLAIGLGVGTYSYYQTTITGEVSGTISTWSFVVNDSNTTFTALLGDLRPGSSGQIDLNLSASGSELGTEAIISFNGAINWPDNLKLYTDSAYTSTSEIKTDGTTTLSRRIAPGGTDTITVYYIWPWDGLDVPMSTDISLNADLLINVVGTQLQPN